MHAVLSLHCKRPSALHAQVDLSYLMKSSARLAVTLRDMPTKQRTKIGVFELF